MYNNRTLWVPKGVQRSFLFLLRENLVKMIFPNRHYSHRSPFLPPSQLLNKAWVKTTILPLIGQKFPGCWPLLYFRASPYFIPRSRHKFKRWFQPLNRHNCQGLGKILFPSFKLNLPSNYSRVKVGNLWRI